MWEEWTTIGYVCLMVLRGSIFHLATTQTVWFRKLYPFVGIYVTSTKLLLLLIDPDFWGPKLNYGTACRSWPSMNVWRPNSSVLDANEHQTPSVGLFIAVSSSSSSTPDVLFLDCGAQQSGTERRIVTESQWAVSFSSLHTWGHNTASPYPRPFHSINRINWDKRFSGHGSFAFPISIIILLVLVQGGCF